MNEIDSNRLFADKCLELIERGDNRFELLEGLLNCCLYAKQNEGDLFNSGDWVSKSSVIKDKTWEMLLVPETCTAEVEKLYWDTLLFEAPYVFESYLIYTERKRPYQKKFYEPRKCTLKRVVDKLQELDDNPEMKFQGVSMPARTGKLVADYTPVLTTKGWKLHGDLSVGDYVYGLDGTPKKITYVHPKHYANKRVVFSDGTHIDCHENHEWLMFDRVSRKERVVETKYIQDNLIKKEGKTDANRWFLPVKQALHGNKRVKLHVPPYVLGAWLGDGTNTKPVVTICNTDQEILKEIESYGYVNTATHEQIGCRAHSFPSLREDLKKYGMCKVRETTQKYIPDEYLNASIEDRLELLAGLIDTDGSLTKKEKRYHFSTINKRLCDDVVSLISTFGWRVCVNIEKAKTSSSGIVGKHDVYIIGFNPKYEIPCKVKRKQLDEFSKYKRIAVIDVVDIEPTSGNCITVDGGIYRVGERLIPTHNSTVIVFFLTWVMGKRPWAHNAIGTHSGVLAKHFYKEILKIIDTDEYCFREIFPELIDEKGRVIKEQSAEEFTVQLYANGDFPSITCRGIDGTWTGAVDISDGGYLCVDDLVRDRQHSLSPRRMEDTFQEYLNKLVDRKNVGAKELMIGTLWSVIDPLMRIESQYGGDPMYDFLKIPALDPLTDESNFKYKAKGFTTQYYRDMRDRLDPAEWCAKYMQSPFVREGLLYPIDELRFFNGILPEGDSRVVAVVDVAWGGGDALSMPVGREYENGDVYIFDWVYNKGPKEATVPLVVGKIMANEIRQCRFEGNVGGAMYSTYVDEKLTENGYKCACTEKKAPNKMSKMEKIIAYSGDVKRKFIFLDSNGAIDRASKSDNGEITRYRRSAEYQAAMDDLMMFVTVGKNEHDDAPDSLTQLCMFVEGVGQVRQSHVIRGGLL